MGELVCGRIRGMGDYYEDNYHGGALLSNSYFKRHQRFK